MNDGDGLARPDGAGGRLAWGVSFFGVLLVGAALFALYLPFRSSDGLLGPPLVGEPIAEFAPRRFETGDMVSLESLRGHPVVLNLWATWCGPCRYETPHLQSLYEEYREQGLEMVGVSIDSRGNTDLALDFLAEHGVTYIQLHDPDQRSMDLYNVLGLPATFVIDGEGVLRLFRLGPVLDTDTGFTDLIETLLELSP